MSKIVTDPNDPDLGNPKPNGQNKAYLVLSKEERARGFIRPVRRSYVHCGKLPERKGIRPLTLGEEIRFKDYDYVGFIPNTDPESLITGTYVKQLPNCGVTTRMSLEIAETYAINPKFYGSTFCVGCGAHFPVEEFQWEGTNETVGS